MTKPGPPLFLERQSYRRRRLVDASRAIPVAGMLLFLVPLLWPDPGEGQGSLAMRGIYIFVIWLGLVAATALVSMRLQRRLHRPAEGKAAPEAGDVL